MKFSEALLLGSTNIKQSFCDAVHRKPEDDGLCALETAIAAIGSKATTQDMTFYIICEKAFPILNSRKHNGCPEGGCTNFKFYKSGIRLMSIVYHLNDVHKWPRPKIAAFVEMYEKQEEKGGVIDVAKKDYSVEPVVPKPEPKLLQYQDRSQSKVQ